MEIAEIVAWPVVVLVIVLVVLVLFRREWRGYIEKNPDITVRGGADGFEVSFKTGVALGAAEAQRMANDPNSSPFGNSTSDANVQQAASVLREATTQESANRLSQATVLWVDDTPNNNINEREALKAVGIRTVISTSTEDAIERIRETKFDAIISDMGRYEDDGHKPRAGYDLLDGLRAQNINTPYFIYAGSDKQRHKDEAKKRGAQGSTNRPQELFELVVRAVLSQRGT
jgi:CheY-like chemotaxis protein